MKPSSPSPPSVLTFHLIPHTHWDREWYLPRAAFQARLVPVLDEVVAQLEHNPEARFVLDGQTVLLEDYLAARPDQAARLAAQVARGALEIGPWYVLSDLLIPSVDSLRRNLAEGRRDAERFGGRMNVLYSPDAFGHPGFLPTLAAEAGIRRAVVRRGLGRPGGADRDLYRWESGGDALLVYHLPAEGYDVAIDLDRRGKGLAERWGNIRQTLVARAATDQVAVFLGADHHAMLRDVTGLRDRLRTFEPGHRVELSSLSEFFDAVERSNPDLPVIRGELRRIDGHAWILQGVHSTRSRMKRRHARAELVLSRIAEPLARRRAGVLGLAWRTLLQCQFHDTLGGTTGDAVQREQETRLASVEALCRELVDPGLREVIPREAGDFGHRLVLWNPLDRARSGIATAELTFFRRDVLVGPPSGRVARTGPGYRPFGLTDSSGSTIPVQVLATRSDQERVDAMRRYPDQDEVDRVWVAFVAPGLSARGAASLVARTMTPAPSPAPRGLDVGPGRLANPHVEVRVSSTGEVTVTDRHTGLVYRGLGALQDEPDRGDTYTFSGGKASPSGGGTAVSSSVIAAGPLVGALETRRTLRSGNGDIGARLLVVLLADSPLVRVRLDLDNRATGHRLRARFPVGAGELAIAGAAVGVERRAPVAPTAVRDAIERPVLTAPAHRFVAAGEGPRGLAVLAPGFFEYEWTARRDLTITLLRSIGELSRSDLPERPGHAAWPEPTPDAEELGLHTIQLALLTGPDATDPERLEQHWEDAFLPVLSVYERMDRTA